MLNGRIGALCSQLAPFPRCEAVLAVQAVQTLCSRGRHCDAIRIPTSKIRGGIARARCGRDKPCRVLVGAKMLDLPSYRPYELDVDDCRFIREAMTGHADRLRAGKRALLWRQTSGTAARLAHTGMLAVPTALLTGSRYPAAAARLSYRLCVPRQVRRYYLRLGNRHTHGARPRQRLVGPVPLSKTERD